MQIDSYWNGFVAFDGDGCDANLHLQQQHQQSPSASGRLFKNLNHRHRLLIILHCCHRNAITQR